MKNANSGEQIMVKLKVDLTRYGKGLIVGIMGWTIPNVKFSMCGSQDRFVVVKFDNNLSLDIVSTSLEIIK